MISAKKGRETDGGYQESKIKRMNDHQNLSQKYNRS